MPATVFVPAPGTVHATIHGTYFGDTVINDIYVKKTLGTLLEADLSAIAFVLDDWWTTHIMPYLCDSYIYTGIHMRAIDVPVGFVYDQPGSGLGGFTGAGEPGHTTLSVKFNGSYSFKGGKPGNRVSGLIEANVVGNTIAVDWAETIRAGYQSLIGEMLSGGTYFWANVSKYVDKAPRTEAFVYPVTSVTIPSNRVHTQRTRVNGR